MNRMYILVNKDLKMSRGKTAAQVAHAVVRTECEPPDTMIVLAATGEQIKNIERYMENRGIMTSMYIDEGVNEVAPYSVTAMAIETIEDTDTETRYLFQDLSLLEDPSWLKRFYS